MAESKILRGAAARHTEKNAPNLNESKADQQKFIDKFGEDVFDLFNKSKDRLKNADVSTDILYHVKNTSPDDMKNILNNLRAKVVKKGDDVDLTKIQGKYRFLGSKDGYDVYEPLDVISSMSLGVGTGWCTTGRYGHAGNLNFKPDREEAEDHWKGYTSGGRRLFYFLQNGIGKYALLLYSRKNAPISGFIDKNTYIKSCNFILFDQYDKMDFSAFSKLPYDLIEKAIQKSIKFKTEYVKDGMLFGDNGKTLKKIFPGLTSVEIPDSVTEIASFAFTACSHLVSLTIPNSIKSIGSHAFDSCSSLKSITLPENIAIINGFVFHDCRSLDSITIPSKVIKIDDFAFSDCNNLKSIIIPDSVTEIRCGAFENCRNLKSVTIPNSVSSFGKGDFGDVPIFKNCSKDLVVRTDNKEAIEYCKKNGITTKPLTAAEKPLQEGGKSMADDNRKILRGASVMHADKNALAESKADQQKFIDKFGKDIFDLFNKSKDRLKNAGISTDILYHVKNTSQEDMKNILNNLRAKVVRNGNDVDLTKIQGKYNYLGSKDGYDVYEPLDVVSSMSLGVGSGWCTTGRYGHAGDLNFKPSYEDAKEHWDEYTEKDVRFFYFLKNGIGEWALALYPYEVEREIIVGDNYYINHCDFELYNQQDYVDYDGLLEIPFDLIEDEMTSQIIVMHDGLAIGDTIGDNYEDKKTLFHCIEDLTTVTIPTDVEVIASGAFIDCRLLKLVTIPDSVKEIGDFAFAGCDNLKSVVIPDSVTEIDTLIFYKCSKKLVVSTNNKLAINYCKENGIATKPLTNGVYEGLTIHEEEKSTGVKSNGIYSVMDGKWIKEPVQADIPDLDEDAFNEEFSKWEKKYFELLDKIG